MSRTSVDRLTVQDSLPDSRAQVDLLLIPALNAMFDLTAVRVIATQIHPPAIIYEMLIALAFASALLAGYQLAAQKDYDWVHKIGFAGIVAFTVYVILDIEYPRLGFVRIDAIEMRPHDFNRGDVLGPDELGEFGCVGVDQVVCHKVFP